MGFNTASDKSTKYIVFFGYSAVVIRIVTQKNGQKMLLTLKNLQQQTFTMDIDPEITVKVLKERIEKEKGVDAYPVSSQKLIYAGKIMADEDSINKYNIDEKKFIVVMVTKGKPAAPAAGASSAPTESAEKKEAKEENKK